ALGWVAALRACPVTANAPSPLFKTSATGDPKLASIDVISFGPEGLLLIGDGKGARIVAVDTGDTKPQPTLKSSVDKINEKLAGRLGTDAKDIEVVHLSVNPASGRAYVALRRQSDKRNVILTVDGEGKIGELMLDNVTYASVSLPAGEKKTVTKVTDITFSGDRVLAAGQSNEEFSSKIFAIPTPLENGSTAAGASTETYHVAHGRWE